MNVICTAFTVISLIKITIGCPTNCKCKGDDVYVSCSKFDSKDAKKLTNATKYLNLIDVKLDMFQAKEFSHLKELLELNLTLNNIKEIPNFSNYFVNLKKLSLRDNQIETIKLIQGLDKLEILELNANKIRTIEPRAFQKLKNLINLALDQNVITHLPSQVFVGLNKLNFLYVQNNRITKFEEDAFSPLSALRILYMYGNNIKNIPSNAFRNGKEQTIILHKNNISSIGKNAFGKLVSTIDLRDNNLVSIPVSLFKDITVKYKIFMNKLNCNCRLIKSLQTDLYSLYKDKKLVIEKCASGIDLRNDTLEYYTKEFDCSGWINNLMVIVITSVIVFVLLIASIIIVGCEMKRTRCINAMPPQPQRFQQMEFDDDIM